MAALGCRPLALDVCDEASVRAAVAEVDCREGAVGVLVNNAGYGSEGPLEAIEVGLRRGLPDRAFDAVLRTMLPEPR